MRHARLTMRTIMTMAVALAATCALALTLAGCGSGDTDTAASPTRVASMKGPTSIGLAQMLEVASPVDGDEAHRASDRYDFTVVGSADDIAPRLASGELDIALVPANLASALYNKTDGGIVTIDVNTLGVLYAVTASEQLIALGNASMGDLAGRTIYMTGKGTVPEYTVRYLLDRAGLDEDDVTIEFKSEPSEVVALLATNPEAVGILPQPFATSAVMKDDALEVIMDLSAQWDALEAGAGDTTGRMVTGVTVVRTAYLDEHPEAVARFLEDHAASVASVADDAAAYGELLVDLGIIGNAQMASAVVPLCNVVCLTGDEMRDALSGYLAALFAYAPAAVGGTLPADDFYYLG